MFRSPYRAHWRLVAAAFACGLSLAACVGPGIDEMDANGAFGRGGEPPSALEQLAELSEFAGLEPRGSIDGSGRLGSDELEQEFAEGSGQLDPVGLDPAALRALQVNELGAIPILMFHRVTEDPGLYDLTPEAFRDELVALAEHGYVPVRMVDVIDGSLDVPLGASPVVLTFDDASPSQVRYQADGRIDPDSALGILTQVAYDYDGFVATGTFYVIGDRFGTPDGRGSETLRYLYALGYELGNHTANHVNLARVGARAARRELAMGAQLIRDAVPNAQVRTLAVPFGVLPDDTDLLRAGSFEDVDYRHEAVLLAGSAPSPSPFAHNFDPMRIPRIRPIAYFDPDRPNHGSGYWVWRLAQEPFLRYVSDGDPGTVAFPQELAAHLDPDFADRARPY